MKNASRTKPSWNCVQDLPMHHKQLRDPRITRHPVSISHNSWNRQLEFLILRADGTPIEYVLLATFWKSHHQTWTNRLWYRFRLLSLNLNCYFMVIRSYRLEGKVIMQRFGITEGWNLPPSVIVSFWLISIDHLKKEKGNKWSRVLYCTEQIWKDRSVEESRDFSRADNWRGVSWSRYALWSLTIL